MGLCAQIHEIGEYNMLCSMTGFGRCEISEEQRKVTVEIKSVNHRYLELNIKLPKKLNYLEADVRNTMKQYVERGKVDVYISYENLGEGNVCLKYNSELAKEYFDIYARISEELEVENDIKAGTIARCPDVISMEEQSEDEEEIKNIVVEAVAGACEKLVEARSAEAERLKKDLMAKLDNVSKNVKFIEERSPEIVSEYREKIMTKIKELLDDNQIDEARVVQEVTVYADKVCVDEEIVRLISHVEAMKETLNSDQAVGRRLDFIAQEMNREANTTLSKTSDNQIADVAIELKTDIEKIREQIQNIE